jgi:hypothetical protein
LKVGQISASSVALSWTASTDDVGVARYGLYRNGTLVAEPTATSYTDTSLAASTSYTYAVDAVDASNNRSAKTATISATTLSASERPELGDKDSQGRTLVWAEEFDGPSINRSVWTNETGMVRNHELQYYTTAAKNQFIENGELVVRGIKESTSGAQYSSASLTTEKLASFQYGRLEARMRVPAAKGSWPAFWLLPWNKSKYANWWPDGGEVDIMEYVSQTPREVYGTAHFKKGGGHDASGQQFTTGQTLASGFHVYAIVDGHEDRLVLRRHPVPYAGHHPGLRRAQAIQRAVLRDRQLRHRRRLARSAGWERVPL